MAPGRKAATNIRSAPSAFDLSSVSSPPSGAYGTSGGRKSKGKSNNSMASASSKKKVTSSPNAGGKSVGGRGSRKASNNRRLSEDAAMPPALPIRRASSMVSAPTGGMSKNNPNNKSWGRMKEWAHRSNPSGDLTGILKSTRSSAALKSTRSSNGGFVSVNPMASREEERKTTHFLKKPSTRSRSNTLASQLDKKRFELDVPLHQRKKSIHGNKQAIEELKKQEEDEKEMRKKRLHSKKSSRVLRMRSGQEPTAPNVATDTFLQGRGSSGKETRLSHLEKATAKAHTKVKKGKKDGTDLIEADDDVDDDQDAEARQYYQRLERLKRGAKSLPDFI